MDYILSAADGLPEAFSAIGYALDCNPRYRSLNNGDAHIYWYRLGAKLGNHMGAYNLGQCYEAGDGVSRNMKLAVFWWRSGRNWGHI